MKSKTCCCNGAVLKRTLFRSMPLWGAYLLCWLIVLPVMILSQNRWHELLNLREYILQVAANSCHLVAFVYGLAAAWVSFSFLYHSRSANFFGALPLKRQTLFLTCYLSGLLLSVIPNVLVALLSLLAGLTKGWFVGAELAVWLGAQTLSFVFYYSFAVVLAMVVGHVAALPGLYVVMNFLVVGLEALIRSLLDSFVYGMWFSGDFWFDWASPLYYALAEDGPWVQTIWGEQNPMDYVFEGWGMLLILAAVGVALAGLAFWFFRRRRMESAGDVIAVRHLKPVFLYGFTFCCSLTLGQLLADMLVNGIGTRNFVPVLLCMLAGAFLGYFVGEMMLHKSVRVFRKRHWANWAVCCVVIVAAMLCVRLDLFGYSRYVPQAQEVTAVGLSYGEEFSEDPALIGKVLGLHQTILDRRTQTERAGESADCWYTTVRLRYRLQNGKTVNRAYELPLGEGIDTAPDSLIRQFNALYNDPDYTVLRTLPQGYTPQDIERCCLYQDGSDGVYLTRQEAYDFLKTVVEPDLRESNMGRSYRGTDQTQEPVWMNAYLEITFTQAFMEGRPGNRDVYLTVTEDAVRTLDFFRSKGFTPEWIDGGKYMD